MAKSTTSTKRKPAGFDPYSIAVLVPCFNEEATVAASCMISVAHSLRQEFLSSTTIPLIKPRRSPVPPVRKCSRKSAEAKALLSGACLRKWTLTSTFLWMVMRHTMPQVPAR